MSRLRAGRLRLPPSTPHPDERGRRSRAGRASRVFSRSLVLAFTLSVWMAILLPAGPVAAARVGEPAAAAAYNLESSYPNLTRVRGYYLTGVNRYQELTSSSGSDQTDLWFLPQADGTFKQFATTPYRECHWDLLRWDRAAGGALLYLATYSGCSADHTEILFRPAIRFMPATWQPTSRWAAHGVAATRFYDNGVLICDGENSWSSSVVGLARLAGGAEAVHTQTDELQTLAPAPGAPGSTYCPTSFAWQENFYLDGPLGVSGTGGVPGGSDSALIRSSGGNLTATRAAGHPQWDSVFSGWSPLPLAAVGSIVANTSEVSSGSPGNTIAFTYTAPSAGLSDATLGIVVPAGWTAPANADAPGCSSTTAGLLSTDGQKMLVSGLTLPPDGQVVVSYGAVSGGPCQAGDGATAPSVGGAPVWQASLQEQGAPGATDLSATPAIDVDAPDGSGELTLGPAAADASAGAAAISFRYSAAVGGVDGGSLTLTLPADWPPPGTDGGPGCTAASAGVVATNGQTIVVSALTLAANASLTVTYGAESGGQCAGGDAATLLPGSATEPVSVEEMSTPGGALTPVVADSTVQGG